MDVVGGDENAVWTGGDHLDCYNGADACRSVKGTELTMWTDAVSGVVILTVMLDPVETTSIFDETLEMLVCLLDQH